MPPATPSLGERLKIQRGLLRMTLAQVGERVGLANGNFVGMVERGERTPSDELMLRLADVLDLPGKELLTLKYAASPRSEVRRLLAPEEPTYPRLRRLLLGTCLTPSIAEAEFSLGPRPLLERWVWQVLMDHLVIPGLDSDRFAPKRLRDHLAAHQRRLRREPDAVLIPDWFEQEADLLGPWARARFEGWSVDLDRLTITVRHSLSPGDETTASLSGSVAPGPTAPAPSGEDVPDLLLAAGLGEDDVDEILTLIELKRRRRARQAAAAKKNAPPS